MNEHVIPLVKSNADLCGIVEAEVAQHNYIQSLPLTAQTVAWHSMSQGYFQKKQIWLFYAGEDESLFEDMRKGNYLSLYEWGEIGDLNNGLHDQNSIKKALKEKVEEYHTKEPNFSVKMLYDMKNNIKVGDFVLRRNKDFSRIGAIGEVVGGYFYNQDHAVNNHCVEVSWHITGWEITKLLGGIHEKMSASPRLQNVTKKDWAIRMMPFIEKLGSVNTNAPQTKKEVVMMEEIEILKQKKQIILQGAPGTGKTYKTASIAVGICNPTFANLDDHKKVMEEYDRLIKEGQIAFCTFHQSMV